MRKKLFTLLLAIVASLGTMFAINSTSIKIDNVYYLFTEGSSNVMVTKPTSGKYTQNNIIIPSQVYTSAIQCASRTKIWDINAGNYNVIGITDDAFNGSTAIENVIIPESIISIGSRAFYNCTGIFSLSIPNTVSTIGTNAFYNVSNIIYHGSATGSPWGANYINGFVEGDFIFSDTSKTTLLRCNSSVTSSIVIPSTVTTIGQSAFAQCSKIKQLTIPNSVTSIGNYAFSGCSSLTSVTIPNSVTSIGDYAFNQVPNIVYNGTATGSPWGARNVNGFVDGFLVYGDALKTTLLACSSAAQGEINIPNSVTSIGDGAFLGCSGLTSVTIPNSVISIGNYAFSGCNSLPVIDNIRYADTYLIGVSNKSLSTYAIKEGTKWIGNEAFYECYDLTSITIPNSVTSIGNHAFRWCSGLTSVTIGNSVTSIGEVAFSNCRSLTSVTIPNSVTIIGDHAFEDCNGLTFVTIGNSVTSIGNYAFENCSGLTSVTISNSVISIGNSAFYGSRVNTINFIGSLEDWLNKAWSPSSISSNYQLQLNGVIQENIIIPNSVISIGNYAFSNCRSLTSVTVSNGVTSIGEYAFSDCSDLTSVTIGDSIKSIGEGAFWGCSGLTSVTIPNNVTSIGYNAFYNVPNIVYSGIATGSPWGAKCRNGYVDGYLVYSDETKTILKACFPAAKGIISIPNSVTSIGDRAFYNCIGMTSVTIGNSVTSIGDRAFYNCSRLANIYMEATNPPSISSSTFSNIASGALVHVKFGYAGLYRSANYWKQMNIQVTVKVHSITPSPTGVNVSFTTNGNIASCGIEGGEQQPGNVLEYIGLEPNSEYNDIPIVLTANTGETETVNISFTTPALELTTKPSKPVSSNTAILLAETNMSDAEISCGFEWKRNDAPADMDGNKVYCPVASGQMAGRLKNLKDDVYYKYRAFYQSAAGKMYYGDWQYIFTGDVTVEFDPVLYTYGATVVHEKDATISGYALAGSEDFTEQGFEYWSESRANGGANAPHRTPAALGEHIFVQASGIALRVTLTNLDAGTVYKYRVYGRVGEQYYYGAEQSFTTQGEYEGDDSEAIDEVPSDQVPSVKALKVLRNGQIFILRGDKVYTVTGQEVK